MAAMKVLHAMYYDFDDCTWKEEELLAHSSIVGVYKFCLLKEGRRITATVYGSTRDMVKLDVTDWLGADRKPFLVGSVYFDRASGRVKKAFLVRYREMFDGLDSLGLRAERTQVSYNYWRKKLRAS